MFYKQTRLFLKLTNVYNKEGLLSLINNYGNNNDIDKSVSKVLSTLFVDTNYIVKSQNKRGPKDSILNIFGIENFNEFNDFFNNSNKEKNKLLVFVLGLYDMCLNNRLLHFIVSDLKDTSKNLFKKNIDKYSKEIINEGLSSNFICNGYYFDYYSNENYEKFVLNVDCDSKIYIQIVGCYVYDTINFRYLRDGSQWGILFLNTELNETDVSLEEVLKDYKSLNFDKDKMETLEISSFDDIRLDFS